MHLHWNAPAIVPHTDEVALPGGGGGGREGKKSAKESEGATVINMQGITHTAESYLTLLERCSSYGSMTILIAFILGSLCLLSAALTEEEG